MPKTWYWNGREVPKAAHDALNAPYRGQTGIDPDHSWVLKHIWKEEAELVVLAGILIDYKSHVFTVLTYKHDEQFTKKIVYSKINVGKVLESMFKSTRVSDEVCAACST